MINKTRYIQKALAAIEDLLVGAGTVTQTRNGTAITLNKINADNLPYSGDAETDDFMSIKTAIDNTIALSLDAHIIAQLLNMGAVTTISATQWGYLGELDQTLTQSDSPVFVQITANIVGNLTGDVLTSAQPNITSLGTLIGLAVTGNITVSGLVDGIDIAARDADLSTLESTVAGLPIYNPIINGDMRVTQRGTSFNSTTDPANSDDTYLIDRWILLSDGNDAVDVTQQSDGGVNGESNYVRLDVETVSKKFGLLQVIEGVNSKTLIGSNLSLSFEAKVTDITKLSDIRAVIVSWDGTVDSVTSDIISAWNIEGTRPTLVANWTEENIDTNLGVTASWARYTIEDIDIDTASTKNIGIFIYQNNVATNDTTGIFLELTNVLINQGSKAIPFVSRLLAEELALCQSYYYRISGEANDPTGSLGIFFTTTRCYCTILFPVIMRSTPSFAVFDQGMLSIFSDAVGRTQTDIVLSDISKQSVTFYATITGSTTVGEGAFLNFKVSAWFSYDAEL